MPKPKRVEKTKEQIAHEFEVRRQQELIEKQSYPATVAATTSVDEAKMLLRAISTSIMESSMEVLRETKMKDVRAKILKMLTADGVREKEVDALLATFDEETLLDSRKLVEGLSAVIEQMILDEMKERTLNSFEINWDRMMQR